MEIPLWVDDARVDETLDQIATAARTGRMGDGKVFVLPVASFHETIDIASGQRG